MSGIEGIQGSSTSGINQTEEMGKIQIEEGDIKNVNVKIKDMGQFEKVAPEVYKKMLQAMATEINNQSRQSVDRIKKINRQGGR